MFVFVVVAVPPPSRIPGRPPHLGLPVLGNVLVPGDAEVVHPAHIAPASEWELTWLVHGLRPQQGLFCRGELTALVDV